MSSFPDDPPKKLADAEQKFKHFLASQGYPTRIQWVEDADVVPHPDHSWSVHVSLGSERAAFEQYCLKGLAKGFGIEFTARCADQERTFAIIYVPEDANDAAYHMIGPGLKMSCHTPLLRGFLV
jgi:hypothetical protein